MVKLNKIFFGVECVFCGYLMRKKMIYVYRVWMNKIDLLYLCLYLLNNG